MKIYHAHGFVVRNNCPHLGEEVWENNSAFGEIFNDFEKAKAYLLACFDKRLHSIYAKDDLSRCDKRDQEPFIDFSESWRMEYIEEYIFYALIISEIDTEQRWSEAASSSKIPTELEWHLRYNGEVQTRCLKYSDGTEREFRGSDALPEAGTKFRKGDLVEYVDRESHRDHPHIYIIEEVPQAEKVHTMSEENHYKLLYLNNDRYDPFTAKVFREEFHEEEIALCRESYLEICPLKEPILILQQIVKGERRVSPELWESGKIIFHAQPSWKEIPELHSSKKNTGE